MLKQRVLTAVVLAAIMLSALFFLSVQYFALVLAVLFGIAAWEWANFAGLKHVYRVVYALLVLALMVATWHWLGLGRALYPILESKLQTLLIATVACWAMFIVWVATYPHTIKQWTATPVQLLMGLVVLVPSWLSLVYLHSQPNGHWLIIIAAATVTCADTGAYFTGRRWGHNKLAAAVSPGKTFEGLFGGIAASLVLAVVLVLALGSVDNWWLVLIVLASSLISVFGDLLESMMKRHRGIKDSGVILPGHGGVLDRIDSITAAAPLFTLVYLLSGWRL